MVTLRRRSRSRRIAKLPDSEPTYDVDRTDSPGLSIGAARPLGLSFATSVLVQGLTVVTGVLLARILGPTGRGELALVLLWPTILAAAGSLGIADAATYFAAKPNPRIGSLVGSTMVIALSQSAALVTLGAAVVHFVHADSSAEARFSGYLALGYIPLHLHTLYLMNILNGLHRFAAFQLLRLFLYAGMVFSLVVLAAGNNLTIQSATISYVCIHGVVGISAAMLFAGNMHSPVRVDSALSRHLLGFGIRSHLSGVSTLLNERLDQLLISVFLAPVRLGLYVVAVTLTSLTNLVGVSTSLIALPALARLAPGPERARSGARFVSLTVLASTAVSLPLILCTPLIIRLFFGTAFEPVANVCRVLIVASILLSTNRSIGAVLKAIGRPLDAGMAELMALAATTVGLALLLPLIGLMGAAIASLVSYAVAMAWMTRRTARALDVPWLSLLVPRWHDVRAIVRMRPHWYHQEGN